MRQVIIENPVLNSPFDEPSRHFRFDEEGITNHIDEERRMSSYFIPASRRTRSSTVSASVSACGATVDISA